MRARAVRIGAMAKQGAVAMGRAMRGVLSSVLGVLLPPRCLTCGEIVAGPDALCAACWGKVDFIAPPFCACCGFPFDFAPGEAGEAALCGACLAEPRDFDRARSVFRYAPDSRDMILAFKHRDRTDAAPAFAAWMARAGGQLIETADIVAPVPLHYWRFVRRRYNQSAMLAQLLARQADKSALLDLLLRVRATPSQQGLSAQARKRNVAGAFRLNPRHKAQLQDKAVLLIDDVHTTGATLSACCAVLKRQGARSVDVLTLARVVRPEIVCKSPYQGLP
jgi:ComF family protein